jgi:hypothetical protein
MRLILAGRDYVLLPRRRDGVRATGQHAFKHSFWRGRWVRNASNAGIMSVKPLFVWHAPPAIETGGFDSLLCRRCLYIVTRTAAAAWFLPSPGLIMTTKVSAPCLAKFDSLVQGHRNACRAGATRGRRVHSKTSLGTIAREALAIDAFQPKEHEAGSNDFISASLSCSGA